MAILRNLLLLIVAAASIVAASAATFSISPSSVAYNSASTITLAVGGIANGQAVLIEEFADDNANGLVDSGEQLLMRLAIRDGEASTFPPSTAVNRPGDDDGSTNGAISKVLRLGALAERLRVAGTYVFRMSAVDAAFAPIVRPFTIEQGSYAQAVTGTVLSGGPLAYAFVALLGGGEDSEVVAGGVSDSNGVFTIRAPVGMYNLIALKPGYVVDFGTAPGVSIEAGLTTTQSITLLPATCTISGTVLDGVTSNGIGGLQIFVQSQQGAAAIAFTDANGAFTVPVIGDMWEVEVSDLSAAVAGYGRAKGMADTMGEDDASGLKLALSRALGEFELIFSFPWGSFNDGTNGAIHLPTRLNYVSAHYGIEDDNLPTNVFFSGPLGSGLNNTPSEYGGSGMGSGYASYNTRSIEVPPYPPGGSYVVSYKGYPQTFLLADPDPGHRQVVVTPAVVVDGSGQLQAVHWTYRTTNGNLISPPAFMQSIEVRIDGETSQLYNSEMSPWTTNHALSSPITWTGVRSVQMVYTDDRANQYVTFWMRSTQPLHIGSQTLPVAPIGNPCDHLFVASGGRSPYSWSIVSGSLPGGVTLAPTGRLTGMPQANGVWNFRVRVTDDTGATMEREFTLNVGNPTPPRLEIRPTGVPGEFGLRLIGDVGRSYSLQYSTTLSNWTTLVTTNLTSPSTDLVDRSATNQVKLYRVLLNP